MLITFVELILLASVEARVARAKRRNSLTAKKGGEK